MGPNKKSRVVLALAILVHATSFSLMLAQVEPFYTYFYSFAWWTWIVVLASFNHLRASNSLLWDRPRQFLQVFFFSTLAWLFFEACNFRLNNWHYIGAPLETWIRWPGYFVAFGTVFPGIFETETCLKNLGVFRRLNGPRLRAAAGAWNRLLLLGVLMIAASLWRPQIFFPLIWLGLIFIFDPILYLRRETGVSLLGRATRGDYGRTARLLLAGMLCGLLWEFWNYWAGSKWVYSIPYFEQFKLFEMPLLGYLGFPFFALECYLINQSLLLASRTLPWKNWPLTALVFLLLASYCTLIFTGIDRLTILDYKSTFG